MDSRRCRCTSRGGWANGGERRALRRRGIPGTKSSATSPSAVPSGVTPGRWLGRGSGVGPHGPGIRIGGRCQARGSDRPRPRYPAGPGPIEPSAQIPILGKNLPVGMGISLGYRLAWGHMPNPSATLQEFLGDPGS